MDILNAYRWKALGQSAGGWQGGEQGEAHTAWAAESVKDELKIPGLLNVAVARHLFKNIAKGTTDPGVDYFIQ